MYLKQCLFNLFHFYLSLDWEINKYRPCQSDATLTVVKHSNASNRHAAQLEYLQDIECAYVTEQKEPENSNSIKYRLCNKNSTMIGEYYGKTYGKPGIPRPIC